jgi:hypothetical protein
LLVPPPHVVGQRFEFRTPPPVAWPGVERFTFQ